MRRTQILHAPEGGAGASAPPTPHGQRYHQVVFIWLKDPEKFARYGQLAFPVVSRYGGARERMLAPLTLHAEGMRKPDIVNIVYYDSRESFLALCKDPEFQELLQLRSEGVDLASIEGFSSAGMLREGGLSERLYLLEVARFGPDGPSGYRRYEEQAEPIMEGHGYHVERLLSADSSAGLPFVADLVKVAYFDAHDGMERMRGDPAYPRIEYELYPRAISQALWLTGDVHPASLAG